MYSSKVPHSSLVIYTVGYPSSWVTDIGKKFKDELNSAKTTPLPSPTAKATSDAARSDTKLDPLLALDKEDCQTRVLRWTNAEEHAKRGPHRSM